jgi:Secretion system C-terminal sorting domain
VSSANELWWSTLAEANNDYFILERSLNGKDYQELGRVKGKGSSLQKYDYSFVDKYSNNFGDYYYKLVQVDYDGKENEFGPIKISVENLTSDKIELFPNPTSNFSTLIINAPTGSVISGKILDIAGKVVKDILINDVTTSERSEIILNSQDLHKGVYSIRLSINGNIQTLRWMVLE